MLYIFKGMIIYYKFYQNVISDFFYSAFGTRTDSQSNMGKWRENESEWGDCTKAEIE